MRILIYTSFFPNSVQPLNGNYVLERMRHLKPFANMSVIAPVPYYPHLNVNQRWSSFAKVPRTEQYRDFEVDHPRYVVFPKVGMVTHGVSMFAGSLLQVRRRSTLMEYDLIDAHHVY